MTVKQGNEICWNTSTALATLKMLADMMELEYDHETEELGQYRTEKGAKNRRV